MRRQRNSLCMVLSAMFLAIAYVLPFFTGQISRIGAMLCPMHLPVLICGFVCGWPWGLIVGFVAPLLRSVTLGMPILFPGAVCMAFELATYGMLAGLLYKKLPKKKVNIYIALLSAMVAGRLVWGLIMFLCMGLDASKFGFSAFVAGAFVNAIPGIILQIIAIPILVISLHKVTD